MDYQGHLAVQVGHGIDSLGEVRPKSPDCRSVADLAPRSSSARVEAWGSSELWSTCLVSPKDMDLTKGRLTASGATMQSLYRIPCPS